VRLHPTTALVEPGLVLLRGVVGRADQQRVARDAWEAGNIRALPEHSFFTEDGALNGPKAKRGRIFDACERFAAYSSVPAIAPGSHSTCSSAHARRTRPGEPRQP
jgi:hypothetical protein